jgi:OCRE domain
MSYDPSGYLFDKTTNLFFDQSTNYFYNSEIGQYLYWNAQNSTYVLATTDTEESTQKVSTAAPPPQQVIYNLNNL